MELKTSKPKLVANLFKTYDPIDPYALLFSRVVTGL
jgi:hypothetical protein